MEVIRENPEMKTLVSSLQSLVKKGYSEDYQVNEEGLMSLKTRKVYQPEAVKVSDFYRFEGTSDPGDESILYAIETNDGSKGTLVDSFGPESDPKVSEFMKKVEEISKKSSEKKD
jgi:hypothetical protein